MEFASIEREVYVQAAPEIVFEVVSSPEHIKGWWPDEADYQAVPGAIGHISFGDVNEGGHLAALTVLTVAPPLIFAIIGVIVWASLRSSGAIMRWVGKGGIEAISRLMGFLLVCMGVQFIINGVLEIIKTYH